MEISSNAALASKISDGNQIKKNNRQRSDDKLVQDIKSKISDHNSGNLEMSAKKKQDISKQEATQDIRRSIRIKSNHDEEKSNFSKSVEIDRLNSQKLNSQKRNQTIGSHVDISV